MTIHTRVTRYRINKQMIWDIYCITNIWNTHVECAKKIRYTTRYDQSSIHMHIATERWIFCQTASTYHKMYWIRIGRYRITFWVVFFFIFPHISYVSECLLCWITQNFMMTTMEAQHLQANERARHQQNTASLLKSSLRGTLKW